MPIDIAPEDWAQAQPITAYSYHPVSKLYTGTTLAHPSPLEPGNYLPPANATLTPPPSLVDGQLAVYEGGAWAVCPDISGFWYNAQGGQVSFFDPRQDTSAFSRTAPPGEGYQLVAGEWVVDQAAQTRIRTAALDWMRARRSRILGLLDGMQVSAMVKAVSTLSPDESVVEKDLAMLIEEVKQGLRDLPQIDLSDCLGTQACQDALQAQLDSLAAALPEDARKAFA